MLYFPLSETSPASEKTVQPTFDIVCNRLLKMTFRLAFELLAGSATLGQVSYTQKGHDMTTKRKAASPAAPVKVARIYMRVSTEAQDLERQEGIAQAARAAGYYVAGIYREKASGARADRPELLRMIDDLQPGEIVVAEKIDRISRLPLAEAERLVASIRAKGARLSVPGIIDLEELAAEAQGVPRIVLESVQDMLLKLALQMARDDYEDRRERQRQGIELAKAAGRYAGRKTDTATHARIVALREGGKSIAETAKLAGCSQSQVKRVCAMARPAVGDKKELARS
nr:recombinase family protein [Sulfuriferula sp. AH1]